jgi:peptide/nickel transport system permease protein
VSAIRQDSIADYVGRIFAISGLSILDFWLGTAVIIYLSVWVGWIPPIVYHPFIDEPWANIQQMVLPAFILGFRFSATSMRMIRSSMLEVLREDYVRTAWAKGLRERVVIFRHTLKNAFIPVITIMGAQIGYLLGGAVVVENIFGLPGVGRLTLDAIVRRDYPQIQVNVMFITILMLSLNMLVDVSYAWLDPRIKYRR